MATSGGHASLLGATFAGYKVLGLVGRGAMGAVYLAHDVNLHRPVALKVLLGSLARNPTMVESFQREARAASPLRHPNIVRMYKAGVLEGTPYLAMEYVEGEPLDRFLKRQEKLPWQTALFMAEQVAAALACAHEHGIIHRDVKPANIMLDKTGSVRLMDFGIANIQAKDGTAVKEGRFMGTPHYMSPEQCAGAAITPTSDLFSLGVMLYRMISGRLPFEGIEPMDLIKKINTHEPPRLNRLQPGVPDDVARLVAHLLAKHHEQRPSSAATVCHAIKRLISEQGGRSALPAALSSFIREQAEVREVKQLHIDKDQSLGQSLQGGAQQATRAVFGRYAKAACVAAWIVAIMTATAGATFAMVKIPPPDPAPALASAQFQKLTSNQQLVHLSAPAYAVADMAFVGMEPVIIATLDGRPGGLEHGARGVVAVDLLEQEVLSLQTPEGPLLATASARRGTSPLQASVRIPPASLTSPVHEAMLVTSYGGNGRMDIRAQRWNEEGPRHDSLFTVPSMDAFGHAAVKPDSWSVCMVQRDGQTGAMQLVEQSLRGGLPIVVGGQRKGDNMVIDPTSVQYSPDGQQIAYMRGAGGSHRELWVTPSGVADSRGYPVAADDFHRHYAFSPDGASVVVGVTSDNEHNSEIQIVSLASGRVLADLGPGIPGKAPWHPSGDFLLARTLDPVTGVGHLWAVESRPPHRRMQLTHLEAGAGEGSVVSRDGRWVAAPTDGAASTLVVIDLSTLSFEATSLAWQGDASPAHGPA
jgi:predicted Ser/Thr protein kinase